MKLKDVAELAGIRAEIDRLRTEAARRIDEAGKGAIETAIATFADHFQGAGFAISEEEKKIKASRENFEFVLLVDDAVTIGPRCTFTLTPPAAIHEPKQVVQIFSRNNVSTVNQIMMRQPDLIRDATQELEEARAAQTNQAPEFNFVLAEHQSAGLAVPRSSLSARPTFATFKEFLNNFYPL